MSPLAVYITSQVFAVAMYLMLALSYSAKSKRKILIYDTISLLANIISFLFLGAWSGLAMAFIALGRNFYLAWDEKRRSSQKHLPRDYVFLAVIFLAIILLAALTYDGPLSLLPVAASLLYTFSIWQKSIKIYKLLGVPSQAMWLCYSFYEQNFVGMICEAILLFVALFNYLAEVIPHKKSY